MSSGLYLLLLACAIISHVICTILIISLIPRRWNPCTSTLVVILFCALSIYQLRLLHSIAPLFLFKITAPNLLPPICVICVYFMLIPDRPYHGSPGSFGYPSLTERMCLSWKLIHDVRGVNRQKGATAGAKSHRAEFIRSQAARFAWSAAVPEILWLVVRQVYQAGTPRWHQLFGPATEFLFLEATLQQIEARVTMTLFFWSVAYHFLEASHLLASVVSVRLGLTGPEDWPPLFGDLKEAYSIGRFWGKFWHQYCRRSFIVFSEAITPGIIFIFPSSSAQTRRLLSTFCIFILSGLVHSGADVVFWTTLGLDGFPVIRFFSACSAAIIMEKVIATSRPSLMAGQALLGTNEFWKEIVGYIWVLAFLCFFTPTFVYPIIRVMEKENPRLLVLWD